MARKFYSNIFGRRRADRCILFRDDYKIRRGIPALPFSKLDNRVECPKLETYPKIVKTIGDHIRAWRIDNNLLQKDVARILSVCEDTIIGWEMRQKTPSVHQIPKITKMIGFI